MRVLFLLKFPLYGAGSGTYTRRLAENLAKEKNYQIAIAAPDKRQIPKVKLYTLKFPFRAVFEGHPEWRGARKYSRLTPEQFSRIYCSLLLQIIKIVEDFKPDVIHVNHASYITWIASFLKSFCGIGYVVTAHGTGIYLASSDRRYRVLTTQALERAEQIIAVSPHTRRWLFEAFGRKLQRKTRVISGGIDVSKFKKITNTSRIDKKYDLKGKDLIIFVGRLTKEKGLQYLIRASKNVMAEIYIIGGGPYRNYLQNYAKLVGANNVHFLGYFGKDNASELKQFYSRAEALVLPSVVDESLGLVVLEAMASETPVIASKKGGIPLVVKDGKNGILIRARSAKAIRNAMNFIIKNPENAKQMGQAAKKIVEEKFSWQVITPQVKKIYERAFEATKILRDKKLAGQLDKFQKEDLERERQELRQKINYIL